jgi:hypothetical protein
MIYFFKISILLFLLLFPQKDPSYNKERKPSTYGINAYVKSNQVNIINDYIHRVDSLDEVYIYTDNLDETNDGDLGDFYLPDYIVITNKEKYIAYEFKQLSKFRQKTASYTERTVNAIIFHELTHAYFYHIFLTMRSKNMYISPEYGTFQIFPNVNSQFGATFIEEGICEYVVYYLHECSPITNISIPDNMTDLLDKSNKVNTLYCYSVIFLKNFLDKNGIKKGIEILIGNRPPTYVEILKPELFYNRLK